MPGWAQIIGPRRALTCTRGVTEPRDKLECLLRERTHPVLDIANGSHHTWPDRATLATDSMAHHLQTTCVPNNARSHAHIYRRCDLTVQAGPPASLRPYLSSDRVSPQHRTLWSVWIFCNGTAPVERIAGLSPLVDFSERYKCHL